MSLEEWRQELWALTEKKMMEQFERMQWSYEQTTAFRTQRLRELLAHARAHSPWHRRRLAGLPIESITLDKMGDIPPMTKADIIENFDEILTDRRLNRDIVQEHLQRRAEGDAALLGKYQTVATGGSGGRRCTFVYDQAGWADCYLGMGRSTLRDLPELLAEERAVEVTFLMGTDLSHMGALLVDSFGGLSFPIRRIPLLQPIEAIVQQLNEQQPTILAAMPSIWQLLVHQAQIGKLKISPARVGTFSEPLYPAVRSAIHSVWPVPLINLYTATETGLIGLSCKEGKLHVAEDLTLIEPVDSKWKPVARGQKSDKALVTNLINFVMPLIRYELCDEVTALAAPCVCESRGQAIEDVQGTVAKMFEYENGARVHRLLFIEPLFRDPNVIEFQVRQTRRGARVQVLLARETDLRALEADVKRTLTTAGIPDFELEITRTESLERHAVTGKLKRFIELEAPAQRERGQRQAVAAP